jgi:hypothetical protein
MLLNRLKTNDRGYQNAHQSHFACRYGEQAAGPLALSTAAPKMKVADDPFISSASGNCAWPSDA